jgi:hypothetical protein
MSGSIKNHILVHLIARIKARLRALCVDDTKRVLELFVEGHVKDLDDMAISDVVLAQAFRNRLGANDEEEVCTPAKVTKDLLAWHLEFADELQTFSPFPVASLSRTHHIICDRVCEALTGKSLQDVFALEPAAWKERLRPARKAKRKRKADRHPHKRPSGRSYNLQKQDKVSTIDTDGCGLGVHIKTRHKHTYNDTWEGLSPYQRAKAIRAAEVAKLNTLPTTSVDLGNDPGGVNLYFMAVRNPDGSHDKLKYTRKSWKRDIQLDRRLAWNEDRSRQGRVRDALTALSESGGYRNAKLETWTRYIEVLAHHWDVLSTEYLENDERCKQRMVGFRLGQRALMRATDRVFEFAAAHGGRNAPVRIGYGDGNVGLGAKGTPTKKLYKAIIAAFKRKRKPGGVLKVSEAFTTKRCYKCGADMAIVYGVIDGDWKENRDFRCCTSCIDKQRKLRNRDFNAAINILMVLKAELAGQGRPAHLKKRAGKGKRKPSNACSTSSGGTSRVVRSQASVVPKST